jgi:hypothetical protein
MARIAIPGGLGTDPNALTVGEEVMPRLLADSTIGLASGQLKLTYFTAHKTETTTQVRVISGSTAAGATPTLVRLGLYSVAANGDLTLVASTANDTTLFAAVNSIYTRSWSSSYVKVAGQRYALGIVLVTAAATPIIAGKPSPTAMYGSGELAASPRLTGFSNQTDLPATLAAGSVGSNQQPFYGVIL